LPELPEVEAVRRQLDPFMRNARIADVELRRADLRLPFPRNFRKRLRGRVATAVTRRAKYLLVALSSNETLLMHLGMSGSFRIEPAHGSPIEFERHDHVAFHMASGAAIVFNDPRRFGVMDLLTPAQLAAHPVLSQLGPEPLSAQLDAAALARACTGRRTSIKAALLDQRVVSGLGNIYASEALHLARLSPLRRAATIATKSGAPRESAVRLTAAIKRVLIAALDRASADRRSTSSRFRVYDREGQPCLRRHCTGTIIRRTQAGRSTFYCRVCQR